MGARDETGDVEQLDGDGAPARVARSVVGFTAVGDVVAGARAVYLEVADGSLGVYGSEAV